MASQPQSRLEEQVPAGYVELVPVSQGPRESLFKRKGPLAGYRMCSIAECDLVKMGATLLSL